MQKGELTKQMILDRASSLASRIGLEGLSIGMLAEDLQLSKSGLFAHFRSKEALVTQVLEHARARFIEAVVKPALSAPRGEKRVRALFERWVNWPREGGMEGGCFFIAASAELDDQPCAARAILVQQQKDWLEIIANVVRTAVTEGQFKKNLDAEQFAFELWGIMLAYHFALRLLGDEDARSRADTAFEAIVARSRK